MLSQNYALKLNNEDYKQMDHQKAIDDFKDRVKAYEQVYEVRTINPIKFQKINFSIQVLSAVKVFFTDVSLFSVNL